MKIRIKGNSLRYRLSKSDIEYFLAQGYIEEKVEFGDQELKYALKKDSSSDLLAAKLIENTIIIYVPEKMADSWTDESKIGFSGVDNKLSLLIEKDFQCLDNTTEDQSDNFPNPALSC